MVILTLVCAASAGDKGRVIGIGGVFLKSSDPEQLRSWYENNLGLENVPGEGITLRWRSHENPGRAHRTIWNAFPSSTSYFGPAGKSTSFMINYVVDDLDALLAKLQKDGVKIDPRREDYEYGRFAWIYDLDGNKVELWEPAKPENQGE